MPQSMCSCLLTRLSQPPDACARILGSRKYPDLRGQVNFYQTTCGVLVSVELRGLPQEESTRRIFGLHIHSGTRCTGNETDPFADAMTHYNPESRPHPHHAGDLPPVFGNHGRSFMIFLTDRFSVCEVLGRTVIVHSAPDDFTSQPSGNSGEKIGCGEIRKCKSQNSAWDHSEK